MSSGINEAARVENALRDLEWAAFRLASALEEVRDAAFGYPSWALDAVNEYLEGAGVRVVTVARGAEEE
jgi:hypothetical protein